MARLAARLRELGGWQKPGVGPYKQGREGFKAPRERGMPAAPDLAIRDGDWKLVCEYDGSQPRLYDLAHDRAETTDLAEEKPKIVQRLAAAVLKWHKTMPPDNGPTFRPVRPCRSGNRKAGS